MYCRLVEIVLTSQFIVALYYNTTGIYIYSNLFALYYMPSHYLVLPTQTISEPQLGIKPATF